MLVWNCFFLWLQDSGLAVWYADLFYGNYKKQTNSFEIFMDLLNCSEGFLTCYVKGFLKD